MAKCKYLTSSGVLIRTMILRMIVLLCLSQNVLGLGKPLPKANDELIKHYSLALDAVFGMGVRLQALLQQEQEENFLVSPISAAVTVAELILGAEGEFQQQLVDLLSLPDSHLYANSTVNHYGKKNHSYDLSYATLHLQMSGLLKALKGNSEVKKNFVLKEDSGVFVDKRVKLRDDFIYHLRNFYSVNPRQLDFIDKPLRSQKIINRWASDHTNGLIKNILGQPPTPQTASIFTNAIYFLAEWETPFSDELNRKGLFNINPSKKVEVTYMIGLLEQILYVESTDYRMIALPYKNEELGMYIILPKSNYKNKYNINTFAQDLKSEEILSTISKGRRRDVVVKIPKMTIGKTFSILDQLKKYRAYKNQNIASNVTDLEEKVEAFANFTTDSEKEIFLTKAATTPLHIDDIVQQVVLTINEKGTEAAAVTATTIDYMGGSKNFIVDSPFVFFVRHEASSATLFWGAVAAPSS